MFACPRQWLLVCTLLTGTFGLLSCSGGGGGDSSSRSGEITNGGGGGDDGGGNGGSLPPPPPPPLSALEPIEIGNLEVYVRDREAAIVLGKALFWDMQLGSDGMTACASCHFHAGTDPRFKNQLNPGQKAGDTLFGNSAVAGASGFPQFAPNYTLQAADFPLHRREDPQRQSSAVVRDTNDVISSPGVVLKGFEGIVPGNPVDGGSELFDPVFNVQGVNVRRVAPVKTPSVINAIFNFASYADGRANHFFNGSNPFGPADPDAGVWVNEGGTLEHKALNGQPDGLPALPFASLASQATAPPVSDLEMSWRGRTWADIGKKMLSLTPLAQQQVHPEDSVLGPYANIPGTGLDTSYAALIQAAFEPRFWDAGQPAGEEESGLNEGTDLAGPLGLRGNLRQVIRLDTANAPRKEPDQQDPRSFALSSGEGEVEEAGLGEALAVDEYELMEANFSLFFALAVQLYQGTLIADHTPFDRFQEGDTTALSAEAQRGMDIFFNQGRCSECHAGALFSNAAVDVILGLDGLPFEGVIERMGMIEGEAFYDSGFYNIGLRPTAEDIGRGGTTPQRLVNPQDDDAPYPLSFTRLAMLKREGKLPPWYDPFVEFLPGNPGILDRAAVDGAQKTPGLRNVELTGPYFRNGEAATLMQVVELYVRGGNFPQENRDNLDQFIGEIPSLQDNEADMRDLVTFMLHLTDERVRYARAPFDHPQLLVPHGHDEATLADLLMEIPAVGAAGRETALQPFLGLDHFAGSPES